MTSLGTIIGRGVTGSRPAAGTPGALYFDTTRSVMQRDNGSSWDDVEGAGGFTSPMTTQDDIIIGGAAGAAARLAKGTDGQVLTVDPTTHHLIWATPSGGGSLTTAHAELTVDVTGGISWALVDILSLASLAAGTYLVSYELTGQDASGGARSLAVLEDPSGNHYGASWQQATSSGLQLSQSAAALITLASTGAIKLRQANGSGTGTVVKGNQTQGGNTYSSTNLVAVKVA